MRAGLWVSGAGGSGVLVGRKEDGTWSQPSGIMLHTAGLGFLLGVDIYDCVVVINTQQALDAFSKVRCTLGGEISAVAGPIGMGGVIDTEVHKRQAPVFTYLKSRGFYAGVQIDGTIVIERTDENERFYKERVSVGDILRDKVRYKPRETRMLLETLKAAQGDTDVNLSLLPSEPPPGDFEVEEGSHTFGIPDSEDPDPYGVLALEKAGLEIKEAGTNRRASVDQFDFRPSPTSPIFTTFRRSIDGRSIGHHSIDYRTLSRRSSTFGSDRTSTTMIDSSTQTELDGAKVQPSKNIEMNGHALMNDIPEHKSTDDATFTYAPPPPAVTESAKVEYHAAEEEPAVVIHSIQKAASPQVVTRARLVNVAKRVPPKLPPRNPERTRKGSLGLSPDRVSVATNDSETATDKGVGPESQQSSPPQPSTPRTERADSVYSEDAPTSPPKMDPLEIVKQNLAKLKMEGHVSESFKTSQELDGKVEEDNFHSMPHTPTIDGDAAPTSPSEKLQTIPGTFS